MSVAANRCHFKNNHYTPPEERYKQIHRRQLTMSGENQFAKTQQKPHGQKKQCKKWGDLGKGNENRRVRGDEDTHTNLPCMHTHLQIYHSFFFLLCTFTELPFTNHTLFYGIFFFLFSNINTHILA